MNLRAIINIEIVPLQAEEARGEGEWERWGWALLLTALVHAVALFLALSVPRAQLKAARPQEPELVLLAYIPPQAAARRTVVAPAPVAAPVAPVQRKARARAERALVAPREPAPIVEKPAVAEQVVQDTPAPAAEEPVEEAAVGSEVVAGLVGSAVTAKATAGLGVQTGEAVDVNQVLRPPEVLKQVQPEYPRQARTRGIEGLVVVRVIVGTNGHIEPEHTRVTRSVPALDAAAMSAVSQWRFSPAIGRQGRVVRVILEVPFQFSLR